MSVVFNEHRTGRVVTEAAHSRRLAGVVREFDEHRGLGAIETADGVVYPFHCIEIADGTRRVALGADVTFVRLAKLGRYEAAEITG